MPDWDASEKFVLGELERNTKNAIELAGGLNTLLLTNGVQTESLKSQGETLKRIELDVRELVKALHGGGGESGGISTRVLMLETAVAAMTESRKWFHRAVAVAVIASLFSSAGACVVAVVKVRAAGSPQSQVTRP
jgi:hypothetical protein